VDERGPARNALALGVGRDYPEKARGNYDPLRTPETPSQAASGLSGLEWKDGKSNAVLAWKVQPVTSSDSNPSFHVAVAGLGSLEASVWCARLSCPGRGQVSQ
jgi:hypothetical protein